jgi:hypothetical protein
MKGKHIVVAILIGMAFAMIHAFSRGIGYHMAHALWRHL